MAETNINVSFARTDTPVKGFIIQLTGQQGRLTACVPDSDMAGVMTWMQSVLEAEAALAADEGKMLPDELPIELGEGC
jgi:hypothetical protein